MRDLFNGATEAFSGLFLMIPGYITSLLALLLLLPPVQSLLYGELVLKTKRDIYAAAKARAGKSFDTPPDVTVIDGDFKVVQSGDTLHNTYGNYGTSYVRDPDSDKNLPVLHGQQPRRKK